MAEGSLVWINDFLKNYSGRDKLLRLWQYSAILCDGLFSAGWCTDHCLRNSEATISVAKSIGSARLVFRLLNIPSTLHYVKETLWAKQQAKV